MLENFLALKRLLISGCAAQTNIFGANAGRIFRKNRSALENVRQLANVAGPVMSVQFVECCGREGLTRRGLAHERKKMLAQSGYICDPLA